MRLPRFSRTASLLLAAFLAMQGCLLEKDNGHGGGSETTIGLAGKVVDPSGNPVSGAAVHIRLEGTLPSNPNATEPGEAAEAPAAITGPDGAYQLTHLAPGTYWVECRGEASRAALVPAELPEGDTLVTLPDAVLKPTGSIRGRLASSTIGGENGPKLFHLYAYIPGLGNRAILSESNGYSFLLEGIPEGTYALRVQPAYRFNLEILNILVVQDLAVASGDTLDLDSLILPYRADIHDAAYSLDSTSVAAFLLANTSPDRGLNLYPIEGYTAMTGNRITMLYDFEGSIKLLSKDLGNLDKLEVIYLWAGPESTLAMPEPVALPNLRRLWLRGYQFDSLPAWVTSFPALASLQLIRANLKSFPLRVLEVPNLDYLDLSSNAIQAIPDSISKSRKLRVLSLSGNGIERIPPALRSMKSLRGVMLRGNRICRTTPDEKAWILEQDSLWYAQSDPLEGLPDTTAWDATQDCSP